jgi:CubicO group peptidase (beta-lactamase class C family)
LDEPVVRYLPTFATADRAYSDRITVRELLSHTSGIPTVAGVDPLSGPQQTLAAQVSALQHVASVAPGQFAYSNANYEVLGELVERLSGQSYAAYLHQHVLAPLDMTHTYTDLRSAKAGGLGDGHRIWFGVGIPTGIFYRADFLPAGFLVSTVDDLDHYLSAILNGGRFNGHSILSPRGIRALISPQTPASALGVAGSYGFGWYQRPTGGLNLDIDPGIAQNVHADLVLSPERHTGLVLLANAESDLYEILIPKFDLAALNATSIAAVGHTSSGLVEGLYVIFDLIVAGAVFVYGRTLVRVVRGRVRWYPRSWYSALAVWREVLVPVAVFLRLPGVYKESWSYLLTGDVGFCAALIAALGLSTLTARVVNGLRPHQVASDSGETALDDGRILTDGFGRVEQV